MEITDRMLHDLRALIDNAEELLNATASQTGEQIVKARARAEESMRAARSWLSAAGQAAGARAREAASGIDEQVHEHPWPAIGLAAAFGVVLGFLLGRE